MRFTNYLCCALLLVACEKPPLPEPAPVPPTAGSVPLHLTMGNPSNATTDVAEPDNYLIYKYQYALAYAESRGTARWVSWHLGPTWLGNAERCDCFTPDSTLPTAYFQAQTWNYSGSGFDRGHMCPSSDRDANDEDNAATFVLTNIMPQAPQLNQGIWAELETYARTLVTDGYELYIVAGGYGSGGVGSQGSNTTLAGGAITIPARYWKVLLIIPNGDDDLERVTADTRVIAVDMPNTQAASALPWGSYRVSVNAIEASAGLDLLNRLPVAVQEELEGGVDSGPTE